LCSCVDSGLFPVFNRAASDKKLESESLLIYYLTAKSFVELAQYLLKQLGVNVVPSAKIG